MTFDNEHKMVRTVPDTEQEPSKYLGELPGSPVVRTPCFHCRGPGFDPWLGN